MNKPTRGILVILALVTGMQGYAQMTLSMKDVIEKAVSESPAAFQARHAYRASYWQYRSFRGSLLPSLNLNTQAVDLNRSISAVTLESGQDVYRERSQNMSSLNLSLSQNLFFTGGRLYLESSLQRLDAFNQDGTTTNYLSSPVNIGYVQPLLAFNKYKWDRKTQPLAFTIAKKNYLQKQEDIKTEAVNKFFELAVAEMRLKLARMDYENSDTLYRISQGRYQIGSISENDLLQMELNYLNSQTSLNEARLNLTMKKNALRSFLGMSQDTAIGISLPRRIPAFDIPEEKAIKLAMEHNPDIKDMQRRLINAEREVARAKANRFDASLYATFGLTRDAATFDAAYQNPQDRQQLRLGLDIPLLDWGERKGKYKMAESAREATRMAINQQKNDFRQNVFLQVRRFNMQDQQVKIAAKKDTVAMRRFEVAKNRFLIGKIDVLKLNVARTEMQQARINYINALNDYWNYYYLIRRLTLYDFERSQKLQADFSNLLQ